MLNVGYLTSDTTASGDEMYTPFYAVEPLVKHLKNSGHKTVWCPFDEEWSAYVRMFKEDGFNVIRSSLSDGKDFFQYEPDEPYDVIISNPPFSKKDEVLLRLDELGKPHDITIVTDGFHQLRASLIAKKQGVENVTAYSAYTEPRFVASYWVREWLGLTQYFLLNR